MGKVIYYFSGTGNSFKIARDLAGEIDAKIIPILSFTDKKRIDISNDTIGIVFPLQDFKAPSPVEEFISKLSGLNDKYIFAICTYGIKPSNSLKKLNSLLQTKGGKLSCGFAVKMPHNGIASGLVSKRNVEKDISAWKDRLHSISGIINKHELIAFESSPAIYNYLNKSILRSFGTLMRFVSVLLFKGVKGLAFIANDDCINCGTCSQVCPTKNITFVRGKPIWGDRCVNCFACVNWCSKGAITLGGNRFNMLQYHHPEVSVKDIALH